MRIRKLIAIFLIGAMTLAAGCGGQNGEAEADGQAEVEKALNKLEDKNYYVLHQDNTVEKINFGEATFKASNTTETPSDTRVMWYAEDYEKIPTLYEGDSLIYYCKEKIDEELVFERFEDIGYTLGLCQLKLTESGRYSLSTKDDFVYPNKETESVLNTDNELVIVDTIGGVPLRGVKNPTGEDKKVSSTVNRYGCIVGLTPNNRYKAEVYSGTEQSEYILTSNIRAFGSMATTKTTDYSFNYRKVMTIKIPEYFNSGYYRVNESGLFRYVKGTSYTEETNFNEPNVIPEEAKNNNTSIENISYASEGEANKSVSSAVSSGGENFSIYEIGTYEVVGEPSAVSGEGDGLPDIRAVITSPSKIQILEMKNDNGKLKLEFGAKETGVYRITYYNLVGRKVKLTVTKKC